MPISGNPFYGINGLIASGAPTVAQGQTNLTVNPLNKAILAPARPVFSRANQGSTFGVLRQEDASPSIGGTPASPLAPKPSSSQSGTGGSLTTPSTPTTPATPTTPTTPVTPTVPTTPTTPVATPTPPATTPAANTNTLQPITLTQNEYGYGLVAKGGDANDKLAQFIEFATAYQTGGAGNDELIQYGKYAHLDARGGEGNDTIYQSLFYSSGVATGEKGDDTFVIGGYQGNAWVDGGEGHNTAILRGPWFTWQQSQQGVWKNWLTNTSVIMTNVQQVLFGDFPEPDVPKPPSFS